jgi:hypothetical protein
VRPDRVPSIKNSSDLVTSQWPPSPIILYSVMKFTQRFMISLPSQHAGVDEETCKNAAIRQFGKHKKPFLVIVIKTQQSDLVRGGYKLLLSHKSVTPSLNGVQCPKELSLMPKVYAVKVYRQLPRRRLAEKSPVESANLTLEERFTGF